MEYNQNIGNLQEYEQLLANVKSLETEIMPQLEMLGREIPEIYKGYAKVVKTSISAAIDILSVKDSTANKMYLAAEIGARTLEAFGEWKAVREHNKMLDRFMATKRSIAELNMSKIDKALSESDKTFIRVKNLFKTVAANKYDLRSEGKDKIERVSNLLLRYLVLYRTNLFILNLCGYLKAEYSAWINNRQTSGQTRTDYYIVNDMILNDLFGKNNHYNALEQAADSDGLLSGAQIMLLSDPQLTVYSLKDTLVQIDFERSNFPIRILLSQNSGIPYYLNQVTPLLDRLLFDPERKIIRNAWIFVGILVLLCVFLVPNPIWGLNLGILGAIAIYRITKSSLKKVRITHVTNTIEAVSATDESIESYCGKVYQPEIDYTRKDALTASLKAFFN
ncbi:MAG: hypothetical protein J1F67_06015 [Muribaculaceae bacterium]|nr:hypothetical protein [Muribaculaceae bacterium]